SYQETSQKVMEEALGKAKLTLDNLALVVSTGYGLTHIPFPNQQVTGVSCQGKGVHHLFPSVRTIIDIGGQSTKVVKVDGEGRALDFVVSEKCATGSGRFLQVIAKVLQVNLNDLGALSLHSKEPVTFSTGCAVFAESEAVSRIAEGAKKEDILAGVHVAIASKIHTLIERVKLERDCALTGGGAKDIGLVKTLEEKMNISLLVPEEPLITAALGAALVAAERASSKAALAS
ncbi:MAG: acyl-CoA dehydratase activase, partial [Chloroflexota bacterium]|nr:acyl-CoA dehydratase activase [Chloroflexota bacterium]